MANEVRIRADVDDRATKKVAAIESRFDKMTKNKGFAAVTQGVGLGVGIGAWGVLGSAIGGATGFMFDSIGAASNLNEQINKSQTIFKGSAAAVQLFGDTSAKAIGISKREALEAAGNFGNMFTAMGLASEESAGMSTNLVTLASDLASFNNIATSDALDKLRAGLTGEAEPLRTMGVLINETAVAAEASALGFRKVNGQFTEGQKVQARYSLILRQTSSAQGDFAKTSGSMANQQRTLNALLEDTQAKLGQKLLPQVEKLQRAFITAEPAVGGLIDAFPFLIDAATKAGNVTGALSQHMLDEQIAAFQAAAVTKAAAQSFEADFRKSERAANRFGDAATGVSARVGQMADAIRLDLAGLNNAVLAGFTALADATENTFTSKQLRDALSGKGSMGKQLQAGLHDARPEVRQAAEKIRKDMEDILSARAIIVKINFDRSGSGRFRAAGGPVSAGQAYVVGEKRPELFVPSQNGTIIPRVPAGVGGSGDTVVHTVINLDGRLLTEIVDKHQRRKLQLSPATAGSA